MAGCAHPAIDYKNACIGLPKDENLDVRNMSMTL
jgi:hypothetical protein